MIAIISERNEVRQEFVCNSADITETAGDTTTTAVIKDAAGDDFKAHHGDEMTDIDTFTVYLFDEAAGVWKRPTTA